jgi:hypothetical protein
MDPMPFSHWQESGAWISSGSFGYRQLLPKEVANALGVDKDDQKRIAVNAIPGVLQMLLKTTSIFHWEYLTPSLLGVIFSDRTQGSVLKKCEVEAVPDSLAQSTFQLLWNCARDWEQSEADLVPETTPAFVWHPPDLQEGGAWFRARMESLQRAVQHYPKQRRAALLKEGKEILRIHRGNYDATGPSPTQLQLIWWEFPREHWDVIRDGSPMNFMEAPPSVIHPNGSMDADALRTAGEFMDELILLGVLIESSPELVETNAPLFAIPKDGQPGEFRVICNMKDGGQNAYISGDPVYLNRAAHILSQMYAGGYSAVVDASKFFYQFKTHPLDRPYLGTIHPITGLFYVYAGLPMGSSHSPALACRYGLAFLRLL